MPVTYKFLSAILVIFASNKVFLKSKCNQFRTLPAYAPIELAIAGYTLSGDGIGRRILLVPLLEYGT
jgi:hypothetical protein